MSELVQNWSKLSNANALEISNLFPLIKTFPKADGSVQKTGKHFLLE
jgi:hypothetical protein